MLPTLCIKVLITGPKPKEEKLEGYNFGRLKSQTSSSNKWSKKVGCCSMLIQQKNPPKVGCFPCVSEAGAWGGFNCFRVLLHDTHGKQSLENQPLPPTSFIPLCLAMETPW